MDYFEKAKIHVKTTGGTVKLGGDFDISLEISTDFGFVTEAQVVMNQWGGVNERTLKMQYKETKNNVNYFSLDNIVFKEVGIHYFCLKLVIDGQSRWIKCNPNTKDATITEEDFPYWSVTVYEKNFEVPDWAKGRIMYHIMVDRFYKSHSYVPQNISNRVTRKWGEMPVWAPDANGKIYNNDFFMGNLKGIQEKISYLKGLGVEILYLSPIFKSQSNHRYDTADYEVVDPYLGNNSDLKNLCDEAHKNGIKIIIDAVFNHTGNDSKYFNEYGNYDTVGAFQSKKSPYFNWYRKKDNGDFDYWWGFKNLPVCDGFNPDWQNYIYGENGIIDKWFALGIDGLRLDVADELTDNFIENIRIAVKRNKKDGFIIGEVWENAVTKEGYGKQRTYLLGKGLDSVMNYPFTNAILKYVRFGNYEYLVQTIHEIVTQYPSEAVFSLMNSLSTHDITRALTTLASDAIRDNDNNLIWDIPYDREWQFNNDKLDSKKYSVAKRLLKIATVIQFFLPGNSCIFYGDEVGVQGYKDPFNRKCFPWDNMDMDLLMFYVSIARIKNKYGFLREADLKITQADEKIFAFERFDGNNKLLVIVNRSEENVKLKITENFKEEDVVFNYNSSKDVIFKYGILILVTK